MNSSFAAVAVNINFDLFYQLPHRCGMSNHGCGKGRETTSWSGYPIYFYLLDWRMVRKELSRPLTLQEADRLANFNRLKCFLATAPNRWEFQEEGPTTHPALNRFLLPNQEYVSCVLWNGSYYVSKTDVVRSLAFWFEAFSRPVRNFKKFEEGLFYDMRSLKPGADACLEEPKV
ncbi:STE like transcription factor-domain-containing protein [Mycena sanguinolenta]|nr:STE like transcription factor-domain-containing protein [Mycena sanguinolenta]